MKTEGSHWGELNRGPTSWPVRSQLPQHLRGPARTEYIIFAIGGALLALSTLMPWVNVMVLGPISLFRLTEVTNSAPMLPWVLVAAGMGLAIAALTGTSLERLAVIGTIVVVLTLIAGGTDFVNLVQALRHSDGFASLDIGFYSSIAALVLLAVGGARVQRLASGSSRRDY